MKDKTLIISEMMGNSEQLNALLLTSTVKNRTTTNEYLTTNYGYDNKGNITWMNTNNILPNFSASQYFYYDAADQLTQANGNGGSLYDVSMSYGNYGRINTSNTTYTDPQTNNFTQQSNNYTYSTVNPPSNSFAPVSANNGTINFDFGINGSRSLEFVIRA